MGSYVGGVDICFTFSIVPFYADIPVWHSVFPLYD